MFSSLLLLILPFVAEGHFTSVMPLSLTENVYVQMSPCLMSQESSSQSPQQTYILKYAEMAVNEMYRSGVPASITLAQGLLESRYGLSSLASKGNNHFGIKCHGWTGKKMYFDDDEKGECFRVYSSAEESFRDHSDFLRYRDRYKSLFDNEITDYKAWANGLKKAGYATDPSYATKLIRIIEDYGLSKYDKMCPDDFVGEGSSVDEKHSAQTKNEKRAARKKRNAKKNSDKSKHSVHQEQALLIPQSPNSLEEPRRITASEVFKFSLSRPTYSLNGVAFVYAQEGDDYESIADSYRLFVKEILKYNDLKASVPLQEGDVVYIRPKKAQTAIGLEKYISEDGGETLYEISQRYAVKLKSLCKMNSLSESYTTRPGDVIRLRK